MARYRSPARGRLVAIDFSYFRDFFGSSLVITNILLMTTIDVQNYVVYHRYVYRTVCIIQQ